MNKKTVALANNDPSVIHKVEGRLVSIIVSGNWNIYTHVPNVLKLAATVKKLKPEQVSFLAIELGSWDNSLIAVLVKLCSIFKKNNLPWVLDSSLPEGVHNLVQLALTVDAHEDSKQPQKSSFLEHIGEVAMAFPAKAMDVFSFLGEVSLSVLRLFKGQAVCSSKDVVSAVYESGVQALPIVSLISMLVGLILAFVGVVQLSMFGAEIYVSSLVAIGMTRIMGAVMTGIVLAGRTGASYAAIIGSMQVNEEVDALITLGVPPEDNLVLPRLIALFTMTPLLVLYADFMGIIGGFIVGSLILGIDYLEYFSFTQKVLKLSHIWVGLVHGLVFGVVVAITGCYQGLRCKRSAEGVGQATTAAVVNSIVYIIISTSILTIFFNILGV